MKFARFVGRCPIQIELLGSRIEISTLIKLSAEQSQSIKENKLGDSLTEFVRSYCVRLSYTEFAVDPVRIEFTEYTRSKVSGIKLVVRLHFNNYERGMPYQGVVNNLERAFKAIRDEISTRTSLPFVNHSTSSRKRLGKGGESIASLKKERDRAKRDLANLKRLIEYEGNRRSGPNRKKSKGAD